MNLSRLGTFHSTAEVEMFFMSRCESKSLLSARIKFFNSCKDETGAVLCMGIILKNNGILLEQISYICLCNDLSFNFYDLRNLRYTSSLISMTVTVPCVMYN